MMFLADIYRSDAEPGFVCHQHRISRTARVQSPDMKEPCIMGTLGGQGKVNPRMIPNTETIDTAYWGTLNFGPLGSSFGISKD